MDTENEASRDLHGNPLRASLSSSEDSSVDSPQESDVILQHSSERKRSTIYWRKLSAATSLLQTSVREHQKRLKDGAEARKSLKEWSERVLENFNEETMETAKWIDVEQVEDEVPPQQRLRLEHTTPSTTSLGAHLKEQWLQSVEAEVEARIQQIREDLSKEQPSEIERLQKENEELRIKVEELEFKLRQNLNPAV